MNQNETDASRSLIKNGKYFVPPPDAESDFKKLFQQMAAAGAGRPVDKDGFPLGQWTPDLLADAISDIDVNRHGVDLRTVQHWFQENDKGISAENIRWLARIFGCGDPDASGVWQVELNAANRRLAAKRKKKRAGRRSEPDSAESVRPSRADSDRAKHVSVGEEGASWRFNLAGQTERLFGGPSSLALPLVVFIGACALGLISFTLNIHSVVFTPFGGQSKQVGFLWAPNWTITFLAVLPLFLALVIDLLGSWKKEWRPRIAEITGSTLPPATWSLRLTAASYVFWAMFVVTVPIASGYNWVATHLIPLLNGDPGNWAVDWGRIAITRPDLVATQSAIAFTGLVFLYNGFAAYIFFAGLILLHLMSHDYLDLMNSQESRLGNLLKPELGDIGFSLMMGIFRCASLGIVITILMKLQSSFLQSNSFNIIDWLAADLRSPFGDPGVRVGNGTSFGIAPGNYYSFFCLLAIAGTFLNASFRLRRLLTRLDVSRSPGRFRIEWVSINGTMALLVVGYFLIGVMPGFSFVLLLSFIATTYLLAKPAAHRGQAPRK